MLETLKNDLFAKITFFIFVIYSVFWIFTQTQPVDDFFHNFFSDTYAIITIWGGISSLLISKKWGGLKSLLGRAFFMFAFGLFSVTFGQISYTYYYLVHGEDMAYPNIGDLGYFLSIFFYIYGAYLVAESCGIQMKLKNIKSKIISGILLLLILSVPYTIFLQSYKIDFSDLYRLMLDLGTPLFQGVYLFIALTTYLLSKSTLGGVMKNKVLWLLFALLFQYVSDFYYIYQQYYGGWIAGGISEYTFFLSYSLIIMSIIQFGVVFNKLQVKKT